VQGDKRGRDADMKLILLVEGKRRLSIALLNGSTPFWETSKTLLPERTMLLYKNMFPGIYRNFNIALIIVSIYQV
jgi:hypothetical protein